MLLQLKDIVGLVEEETAFIDDRTNSEYQLYASKSLLLSRKDWFVVYLNSEFRAIPAEEEPVLCIGIVKDLQDWKDDKSHT